jgi:hypothetical protein
MVWKFFPPLAKQGEVSASHADGGVMSLTPPSAYEADTSPAKLGRKGW